MKTISARFRPAWRRQVLVSFATIVLFVTLGFWDSRATIGLPYRANGFLGPLLLAGFAFFTWRNWRCPQCNGRVSMNGRYFCSRCARAWVEKRGASSNAA